MINVICVFAVIVTFSQAYYVPQIRENLLSTDCTPNKLYANENVTCICSQAGTWPLQQCKAVFGHLIRTDDNKQCEPYGYTVIECNVCRCTSTGVVDHSQCTKNVCEEEPENITRNKKYRRADGVLGTCVASQWYSMGPCQYCYCANKNKLLCNTGSVSKSEMQLGSYKLSVCETNLQQDINALYPKPLRDGGTHTTTENKAEEPVELKTKDDVDVDDFAGINAKPVDQEKYKEDEKDEEMATETTANPVTIHVTKPKPTKAVTKKILTKETPTATKIHSTTAIIESSESEIENSVSNEKVEVGLNLDLDRPQKDKQVEDDQQDKVELDHTLAPADDKENNEATKSAGGFFNQPNTLSDMLDTFIHLALRKSMMILQPGDECEPGTQTQKGCNLCFCLKNGKLLCTNKSC